MANTMIRTFRRLLLETPQAGVAVSFPDPGVIETIGPDWDWVLLDHHHGVFDFSDIVECIRACNLIRRPVIVQAHSGDTGFIGRILDAGADGVMTSPTDGVSDARGTVSAARFRPEGERVYGGRRIQRMEGGDHAHPTADEPLVICRIDSRSGLDTIGDIVDVDGLDAVFLSVDGLSVEAGMPLDIEKEYVSHGAALHRIAAAANSRNKFAGTFLYYAEMAEQAVGMGYRLFIAASDAGLLASASSVRSDDVRELLSRRGMSG